MAAIQIEGLHKEFSRWRRGRRVSSIAVRDLDIEVPDGGVFGFLGPNGSGKTTTIRCLLGLVRPTRGRCRLLGRDVADLPDVIGRIGAMVETPVLFPTMTGRRNLELLARLERIGARTVAATLERVGLGERADDLVRTYSLGMRQRLSLAGALIKDPDLLLLDEPANGLDPAGIREMRELLRGLGDEGRTIFVSSHHLAEIEQICDGVAIVAGGQAVCAGPVADVLRGRGPRRVVVGLDEPDEGRRVLARAGLASTVHGGELLVDVDGSGTAWVNRVLADAGLWLTELRPLTSTLEDVFLELTGTIAEEVS